MKLCTVQPALLVSGLFLAAGLAVADPVAAAAPAATTTDLVLKTMTYKGCYNNSTPLVDQGSYTWQSSGYCQKECVKAGYAVLGLWKGSNCLCGNELPAESALTSDSECDTECDGWPQEDCGGSSAYSVWLTGTEDNDAVSTYSASSTTSTATSDADKAASTTADTVTVITEAGQTIVVTAASDEENVTTKKSSSGGTNTAAIAIGVVVGVVGLCSLAGAGFFLWRYKKRKAIEAEYRRNAAMEGYGKPMSTSSMSDARFDSDYMAQRRLSNGSIPDDQDFSRRILKVTNPDD
ncbi:hypothetical protein ASPZODRAFT_140149 [Penicilliopsis zonata CBS 506.65]|uniref:WSC domain-containing protein n=1 Tax=Penicilliopsis zonata CBS 506.65 TaxID=1073090 RepID=A0A1L9SQ46_9EURO|nr:hypothetical protein ASPZODRAFT_140149 [Penicilliopsis zonata CBS 506.65]OJJ49221.1 hypothetical protein ASPZODRAFT_140149 [Penicilliopsis zonata CBS 506.65]